MTEAPNGISLEAGVPVTGTKLAEPVGVPHTSGLAIAVSTSRLKCRLRLVNGCSGFSRKAVLQLTSD